MSTDIFDNGIIEMMIHRGYKKFYIYPYGKVGMKVEYILKERYGIENLTIIDNKLCHINPRIVAAHMLAGKIWDKEEAVIITASNINYYMDIRLEIFKYIPQTHIFDLFPVHPLIQNTNQRIASLAAASREIYRRGLSGSVAEAGVYRGDFAKYINILFPDRKLYLFDTFEGFDRESIVSDKNRGDDIEQVDGFIDRLKDTSVSMVMGKMTFSDKVIIRKGLFPHTAENIKEQFVFVNLDMDLYQPIYDGLNYFYDNLVGGGIIFVHDFYVYKGCENAVLKFCSENQIGYFCLTDENTVAITKPI